MPLLVLKVREPRVSMCCDIPSSFIRITDSGANVKDTPAAAGEQVEEDSYRSSEDSDFSGSGGMTRGRVCLVVSSSLM